MRQGISFARPLRWFLAFISIASAGLGAHSARSLPAFDAWPTVDEADALSLSSEELSELRESVLSPLSSHVRWPRQLSSDLDSVSSVLTRSAVTELRRGPAWESSQEGLQGSAWEDFDMEVARKYAQLTSIAYCSDADVIAAWNCTRCLRVPTFTVESVVFDHHWDLLGYVGYLASDNAIVAAFRGTDSHSWTNWIEDLRSWRQDGMWPLPEAPTARVHAGFFNLWSKSSLGANVTAAIAKLAAEHPDAHLYVTGHSMGAAMAQICAMDAKFKLNISRVHSFTFGSPRIGNAAFYKLFEQKIDESWRFTHNRDVVPSLPPTFLGYHHVAREIWTVDVQPLVPGEPPDFIALMCDTSGEDPSCHNSACLLGLCTSVADHLTYLQVHMYRTDSECGGVAPS